MSRKLMTGVRIDQTSVEASPRASVRLGEFLKKLSASFGWPMFVLLCLVPPEDSVFLTGFYFDPFWWIGVLCCIIGTLIRFWSFGYLAGELFVLEGPFRYVRNPVQVAYLFIYAGVFLLFQLDRWVLVWGLGIAFVWMHLCRLALERALYLNIGPLFLRYKERVSLWWPSFLPEINREGRSFVIRSAFLPNFSEFIWLMSLFLVYLIRNRVLIPIS